MPTHETVVQNLWVVIAIAVGGGGFASQVAGVVHNDLGCGLKVMIGAGVALIIFASIWFLAPTAAT